MAQAVLEFDNASVIRSGRHILGPISWQVAEGERWAILGPNGAGKTTLVGLASARLHPSEGKVSIVGERLGRTDVSELRPLVGLASAGIDRRIPASLPVIDVVRTASYGTLARWRETYEAEDNMRAEYLLEALGVASLAHQPFNTLSSGEIKRVGIARALMPNPEILILDEPTSGLDLGGREGLLSSLAAFARDETCPVMLHVTHHVEDIPQGFTHALILSAGQVVTAGPIDDVITSDILSSTFGLPLEIRKDDGRFFARAL